jgi:hypothetical protein
MFDDQQPRRSITTLSFVADRKKAGLPPATGRRGKRCFWHVSPSGHYGQDWRTGEQFAIEFLGCLSSSNEATLFNLSWIVADMPRDLSGIENGFLTIVSAAAAAGRAGGIAHHLYSERRRDSITDPKIRELVGAPQRREAQS